MHARLKHFWSWDWSARRFYVPENFKNLEMLIIRNWPSSVPPCLVANDEIIPKPLDDKEKVGV